MTGFERLVIGAAYATTGRYANALHFARCVVSVAESNGERPPQQLLDEIIEGLTASASNRPIGQKEAAAALMLQDLALLRNTLERNVRHLPPDAEALGEIHARLSRWYEEQGIIWRASGLFIVDTFPSPYSDMPSWALSCDVSDARAYGMSPGIYLRREWLMPFYTPFLLAHEMLHSAVGQTDSDHLARGLEEGLADIVGSLLATRDHLLAPELSTAMLINSRLLRPREQFWDLYNDGLRLALTLHDLAGREGLIDLVRDANRFGRGRIAAADASLVAGNWNQKKLATGDPTITTFGLRYRCFNDAHVVSPLAYYIGERVAVGISAKDLIEQNELEAEAGRAALKELQERVMTLTLDDGVISAAETPRVIASGGLRYELNNP